MRVLKFGGSSLSSPKKILHVAKNLAKLHKRGEQLVVVVSAMGETTNQLLELAKSVSRHPNPRELDMLLTTGERVSMALLSMALRDLDIPAISFTGSQSGILTDAAHFGAKIIDIRPTRVLETLHGNNLVIVAGFQGVDPFSKEITTLGRGGSDTSAVALATALHADSCDLLKDIDELCSADPKLVKKARRYKKMDLQTLNEMCFWGAKVLHHRSVEMAHRNNVSLGIGSSKTFKIGTRILGRGESMPFEQQEVLAINSHALVNRAIVKSSNLAEGVQQFEAVMAANKLTLPQVLASNFEGKQTRITYTSDKNHLEAIHAAGEKKKSFSIDKKILSSVTMTCYGSIGSQLLNKAIAALKTKHIDCEQIITGPLSLSFFVLPEQREHAIALLHKFVKGT